MVDEKVTITAILRDKFSQPAKKITSSVKQLDAAISGVRKTSKPVTKAIDDVGNAVSRDPYGAAAQQITKSTRSISQGVERLDTSLQSLRRVAGPLAATFSTLAVAFAGLRISQVAADADELDAKFKVVFASTNDLATAFAKDLSQAVGVGEQALRRYLATLQDTFIPLGFAEEQATDLSTAVTELAVDVSRFNNKASSDVLRDFQSALVGNSETVRKYGVILTEARIQAEGFNEGLDPKNLTAQEKVLLRLKILFNDTAQAQGQARREADLFNAQVESAKGNFEDLAVELGRLLNQGLLPLVRAFNDVVPSITQFVKENQTLVKVLGSLLIVLLGIVPAFTAVRIAVALYRVVAAGAALSTTALGKALTFVGVTGARTAVVFRVLRAAVAGFAVAAKAVVAAFAGVAVSAAAAAAIVISFVAAIRSAQSSGRSFGEEFVAVFKNLASNLEKITDGILSFDDIIIGIAESFAQAFVRVKGLFFDPLAAATSATIDGLQNLWQVVQVGAEAAFKGAGIAIKKGFAAIVNSLGAEFNVFIEEAAAGIETLNEEAAAALRSLKIPELKFDTADAEADLRELTKQIPALAKGAENASKRIKDAFDLDIILAKIAEEEEKLARESQSRLAQRTAERVRIEIEELRKAAEERKGQEGEVTEEMQEQLDRATKLLALLKSASAESERRAQSERLVAEAQEDQEKSVSEVDQLNSLIQSGRVSAGFAGGERDRVEEERNRSIDETIAKLQELKKAAESEDEKSFLDAQIRQAEQLREQELPALISGFDQVRLVAAQAATGPLTDFFESLITGTKDAKTALKDFALAFLKNLASIIAQMLALQAISIATGVPVGVVAGGASFAGRNRGGLVNRTGMVRRNEGGFIPGRGPDRDTVPALLTRGEFVHRRSAVDHYGTGIMEALNKRLIPRHALAGYSRATTSKPQARYNTGGAVRTADSRGTSRGGTLPIFTSDPATIDQMLAAGENGYLNFVERNRTEIRGVMDGDGDG